MKKILIFALCCVMLITTILPVSAEETTEETIVANVTFPYDMTEALAELAPENGYTTYYTLDFSWNGTKYYSHFGVSKTHVYYRIRGTNTETTAFSSSTWQGTPSFRNIQLLSMPGDTLKEWLETYAEVEWLSHGGGGDLPEVNASCDGSMCPVRDANIDNTCDTCGKTLAYSVTRSYTPNGFPNGLPAMPVGFGDESQYILFKVNGEYKLYIFQPYDEQPVGVWNTTGTESYVAVETLSADGKAVTTQRYTYRFWNSEWQYITNTETNYSLTERFVDSTVEYSTLNLYKHDGTLFFPHPLWEVTQRETLSQFQTMVTGTMGTLTIVGVSLLALLIGLILLPKVLKRFLG